MNASRLALRWDLWLPAAGIVAAVSTVLLAITTARAQQDRHAVVVEGRLLRLAHRIESELREVGPSGAAQVLAEELDRNLALVAKITLLDGAGGVEAEVGSGAGTAATEVELFLGRTWRGGPWPGPPAGPRGRGRGRRIVRLEPAAAALVRPLGDRLLLPVAGGAGAILVALSILGGVLLVRQREADERRAARERLEGLARAGAGLAHQLRNPLATIKGSCQLLLEKPEVGREKRLAAVLAQTERMERLISHLLDYARPPEPEAQAVDLAVAGKEVAGSRLRVQSRIGAGLWARVDPEHLQQILINLMDNALRASPKGDVEIGAATRGGAIEITVADRGPGPEGDPERLFEPWVSSRPDGTGLGLPIARALAQANGGHLVLAARPDGGTVARLTLPAAEAASA